MSGLIANGSYVLKAGNDETVLYEGDYAKQTTIALSESLDNFERVKIEWCHGANEYPTINNRIIEEYPTTTNDFMCLLARYDSALCRMFVFFTNNKTSLTLKWCGYASGNTSTWSRLTAPEIVPVKVIGINRKESA